jgi:hypothetical protein
MTLGAMQAFTKLSVAFLAIPATVLVHPSVVRYLKSLIDFVQANKKRICCCTRIWNLTQRCVWNQHNHDLGVAEMDEGRKRVLAIVAGIIVARHLKTADDLFGGPQGSPRTDKMVAAAVQWAERIMRKIDSVCSN